MDFAPRRRDMRSKINIDIDEIKKDICKNHLGVSSDTADLKLQDVLNIDGIDVGDLMDALRGASRNDDSAIVAGTHLAGIIIGNIYSSIGTDYALGEISARAVESIDPSRNIDVEDPVFNEDTGETSVSVVIYDEGLHRMSVAPEKYGSIDNILELLNYGYTARRSIRGKWHGVKISTLRKRLGAWFFDDVIEKYLEKYGKQDGVVDVDMIS